MRHDPILPGTALVLALLAACSGQGPSGAGVVVMDTIGDTIVAHTGSPGAWGAAEAAVTREVLIGKLEGADEYTFGRINNVAVAENGNIYVLDGQVPVVRRYAPDGQHIASFGRSGGGPGELKQVDGLALMRDGRVLVRDPGNGRINVYDSTGTPLSTWQIRGGSFFSETLYAFAGDDVYTPVIAGHRADGSSVIGYVQLRAGVVQDTVLPPYQDFTPQVLTAARVTKSGSSRSSNIVPFSSFAHRSWSPEGRFVGGISSRYSIDTFRPDGKVFRIEHEYTPVAVQAGERAAAVERITRNMRNTDPAWRWNGPQPPEQKPPFRGIAVGQDGRIWVLLHTEASRQPPDPEARPDPRGLPPLEVWTEPSVYEVFEAAGSYLGRVRLPDTFTPHVMRGELLWGIERDDLGVEYVARYRVTPPAANGEGNN